MRMVRLLVGGEAPEGQVLVADTLNPVGGNDADATGVEQKQRQPLRGRLRHHSRVEILSPMQILGLSGSHDLREIELFTRSSKTYSC